MSNSSPFSGYAAHLRDLMRGDVSKSEFPFPELALHLFQLQFTHNPTYRRLCEARRVTPQAVRDWRDIPAVPTVAFKELELTSLPPGQRTHVFHSSGTTEHRPSRHFHDAESLAVYEASLLPWFKAHLLEDTQSVVDTRVALVSPSPGGEGRGEGE